MTDHRHIVLKESGRTALIELNRPEALNALSTPLMEELLTALLKLEDEKKCRAVVITGRGKAFSAGADIAEMEKDTAVQR